MTDQPRKPLAVPPDYIEILAVLITVVIVALMVIGAARVIRLLWGAI